MHKLELKWAVCPRDVCGERRPSSIMMTCIFRRTFHADPLITSIPHRLSWWNSLQMLKSSFLLWAHHFCWPLLFVLLNHASTVICSMELSSQHSSVFPILFICYGLMQARQSSLSSLKENTCETGPLHSYICVSHTGHSYKGQQSWKHSGSSYWRFVTNYTAMNISFVCRTCLVYICLY